MTKVIGMQMQKLKLKMLYRIKRTGLGWAGLGWAGLGSWIG